MITTSNSSVKEERAAQSIARCATAHHRLFGAWPGANRTFSLARNPIPCATSSTNEWPVAGHRNLGDLPAPAHHQVEILAAPFRKAANCDLGRFHHQEAQHRTPLFGDMPQSSPIPARVLQRYQSQIARDLLATLKPIRSPDD